MSNVVESPPALRSTILGSFLRGRPRGLSTSQPPASTQQDTSPSPPASPVPPSTRAHRRRSFVPTGLIIPQLATNGNPQTTPVSASLGISNILRRRRSTGQPSTNTNPNPSPPPTLQPATAPPTPPPTDTLSSESMPLSVPPQLNRGPSSAPSSPNQTHRIRLVPHLDSRRTLRFEPITRDIKDDDPPLRIGRFTDRSGIGLNAANLLSSNKLAFKSKVVSRSHAEIWLESGKFFIRDTKSSSGTFLNHLRLSPAGHESRPYQLRDGDVLQLGVDYQGGSEDIYKSVKIKIEVGREWQAGANAFKCVSLHFYYLHPLISPPVHMPSANSRHSPSPTTQANQIPKIHQRTNDRQKQISQTVAYVRFLYSFLLQVSYVLSSMTRSLSCHYPSSPLYRTLFTRFPLQMYTPTPREACFGLFLPPLPQFRRPRRRCRGRT